MSVNSLFEESHRRFNILTGEWLQVSPHRMKRPWQGKNEKVENESKLTFDKGCYLCPGNERASKNHNPNYKGTFVFDNDFGAIIPTLKEAVFANDLLQAKSERGICRVICFSPRHDLTIPELSNEEVLQVVNTWIDECNELKKHPFVNHIQIFENKGSIMGCSNPHPHGQIWAQESIPIEPAKKQASQLSYWEKHQGSLLLAYLHQELKLDSRIVFQSEHFVVLVPFWAIWPFETMIIPRRRMSRITEMSEEEKEDFAKAYKMITTIYDNLFEISFPYSAGIHQAPFTEALHPEWHWHMVFYPPLLRSATVKKFMVGYEMLANPQRDLTPEQAAKKLRELPTEHYKLKN